MTSQLRRKRPITAPSTRPTAEPRPSGRCWQKLIRTTAWTVALVTALDPLALARQARSSEQPLNTWTARQSAGKRTSASIKPAAGQASNAAGESAPARFVESAAIPSQPDATPASTSQPDAAATANAGTGAAPEPARQDSTPRWHARRSGQEFKSAERAAAEEAKAEFAVKQTAALEPVPMNENMGLRPVPTRAYPPHGPVPASRLVPSKPNDRQPRRGGAISSSNTRARTRSTVLMVSGQAEDPFRDPFADEELKSRSRTRDAAGQAPAAQLPGRSAFDPGDPVAAPRQPEMEEPPPRVPVRPNAPPAPPPSLVPERTPSILTPEPTPQAQQTPCESDKRDCRTALSLLKLNTIDKIALDLRISGVEGDDFPCECTLGNEQFAWRSWSATTYTFKASSLCHKPLYFEDVQLERYGHSWNPALQSILSGAHFITCVAFLPYNMAVNPPNECMYTLGYYRPGSCAPYVIEPVPISLKGVLYEAGFVATGLWILHLY